MFLFPRTCAPRMLAALRCVCACVRVNEIMFEGASTCVSARSIFLFMLFILCVVHGSCFHRRCARAMHSNVHSFFFLLNKKEKY